MLLELISCEVGHYEGDDIAHDSSKITPQQALIHHEIGHGTDKGKMPVVPQVNINGSRELENQHQQIDAQTDGDNQRSYGSTVGHSCRSRPTHVKHLQLQVVKLRDGFQGAVEVGSEQ